MRKLLFVALLSAFSFAIMAGEPSSRVSMNPELLKKLKQANTSKGNELAASCGGCHGTGGSFPSLEGQLPTYLYKQLQDYKDGHRNNPIMSGLASTLSEEDMVNLAAYYGQRPLAKPSSPEVAKKPILVTEGDSRRILPPCSVCHETNGTGQKLDIPALVGQPETYLLQTLRDYKSGVRHNDLYGRMQSITQEMTDAEIAEVARYYAGMRH